MHDTSHTAGIRKPTVAEAPVLEALIADAAGQGAMLHRSQAEICESIRDFFVYGDERGIAGCCALHVDTPQLAEIRSLVVAPDRRGAGIGDRLVEACIDEARALAIARVYALTRIPDWFEKRGFRRVPMNGLPEKVFKDCVRCALYPTCDEVAVVYTVGAERAAAAMAEKEAGRP